MREGRVNARPFFVGRIMDNEFSDFETFKKNIPDIPTICGLVLEGLENDFGDIIPVQMLLAIERKMGWALEIIGAQNEAEDILLDKHNSFDSDIWIKVTETKSWKKLRSKIDDVSRKYLALAIDEVVQSELQDMAPPNDPLL